MRIALYFNSSYFFLYSQVIPWTLQSKSDHASIHETTNTDNVKLTC